MEIRREIRKDIRKTRRKEGKKMRRKQEGMLMGEMKENEETDEGRRGRKEDGGGKRGMQYRRALQGQAAMDLRLPRGRESAPRHPVAALSGR